MNPQPVVEIEGGEDALRAARRENETLYAVIKTVSSSLDLDRVLRGIVDIATDATGCHACFIYFVEGDRLVLRAASPQYARMVGEVSLGTDEGLAGWVARTKTPEFIPENAMADQRMKYVPELEEESDCERRIREWTSQGYTRTLAEHILEFSDREGIGQVG